MSGGTSLQTLQGKLRKGGDLPVLRDSVIQALRAAEGKAAGAADVARVILQDQGFAVKILKVANSAYFNQGHGEINSVSKAVVVLGLDMIRSISLGLSFVEFFQKRHPGIDLKHIIANSFVAATVGEVMADRLHYPKREEVFLAALLYNLGEISTAYYLPEEYLEIRRLEEEEGLPAWKAEQQVLGTSAHQLGIAAAKACKIPDELIEPIAASEQVGHAPAQTPEEKLWAISCLANRVTHNLFSEKGSAQELDGILRQVETTLALKPEESEGLVQRAYKKVKEVCEPFGIETEKFKPPTGQPSPQPSREDGQAPSTRLRLLENLERIYETKSAAPEAGRGDGKAEPSGTAPAPEAARQDAGPEEADPGAPPSQAAEKALLQLKFLQEISAHLYQNQDLNVLFSTILEGIHRAIGFDRALLVFCNPSKTRLTGRYGIGPRSQELAQRLDLPNSPQDNAFAKSYAEQRPLFVENAAPDPDRPFLSEAFLSLLKAPAFVISPIRAQGNVIGFFYADKAPSGQAITQEDYRTFEHFALQANIALERIMLVPKT